MLCGVPLEFLIPRLCWLQLNIDPESLIPQLPKPQDLRPFPTTLTVEYIGHTEKVRSISVSPDGQWIATGKICLGCLLT